MEPESVNNAKTAPRKLRFGPKAPPKKPPKPAATKAEVTEDPDVKQAKDLLRRFSENAALTRPKTERKISPSEVAFGYGGESSSLRSFGFRKSSVDNNGVKSTDSTGFKVATEYKEPWDYYTYYPVALPTRKPYSGNPELLDEEEFREHSEGTVHEESSSKPALELGLMEENLEPRVVFLQFPAVLPAANLPSTAVGGLVVDGNTQQSNKESHQNKASGLEGLPRGCMGKILVYSSGAVKLKMGNTMYNISSGVDCVFAQDAVVINSEEKQCCVVGELTKRAVVTPDIDSMIDDMPLD